jgi:protein-S-isoprenylcysteine O-methyltransferase Ste14
MAKKKGTLVAKEEQKEEGLLRATVKMLIISIFSTGLTGALLFVGAGHMDIFRAWQFLGIMFVYTFASMAYFYHHNPAMVTHRLGNRQESEPWDRWLMPLFMLLGARLQPLVVGLDIGRYGWTRAWVPQWALLAPYISPLGFVLYTISFAFGTWAMGENRFFEAFVRIQKERDHYVIDTGPYAFVRHPGYAATLTALIGIPLFFGSAIAIFPGMLAIAVIVLRTSKEDAFLQENLDGYKAYTRKVRHRLVPGIW